ncbi:MAG: YggS family pyridoxal phosphate-dependent enzyme [Mariprofundaceae bacterium]|nr:YggS family pyridoxal phosphate-dependent enzyme [Mariprofundaceae bacterium]
MSLKNRYLRLQQDLLTYPHAQLVAVSKYTGTSHIEELAALGQRVFAESRPQQLRDRAQLFPELDFHMIGPLQKNKAKYVARYARMWHSLEDIETAKRVNHYVVGKPLPVLLQVKLDADNHHHGVNSVQLEQLYDEVSLLTNLQIKGLMCMAAKNQNAREIFQKLKTLLCNIGNGKMATLSMGMSGDYKLALAEGSTMIRVGSSLFGQN